MKPVTDKFKMFARKPIRNLSYRVWVRTKNPHYIESNKIQSISIDTGSTNGFVVGAAYCAKMTLTLVGHTEAIPNNAELTLDVTITDGGETVTSSLGTFYCDSVKSSGIVKTVIAYDEMMHFEKNYYQQTPTNRSWYLYFDEILAKHSVNADRTYDFPLSNSVTIDKDIKKGTDSEDKSIMYTYRAVLGYIASANATSFFFRGDLLCAARFAETNEVINNSEIIDGQFEPDEYEIKDVALTIDGQSLSLKDTDAYGTIQFVNPLSFYPREAVAGTVLRLKGLKYNSATIKIHGHGWHEIGDLLTAYDKYGKAYKLCVMGIKYNISANEGFTETIYSSALTSTQSNYNNGDISGQVFSPAVVGNSGGSAKLNYMSKVAFNADGSGFTSTFTNGSGSLINNEFEFTVDSEGNITRLHNKDTGKNIDFTNLKTMDEFLTKTEIDDIWAEVIAK